MAITENSFTGEELAAAVTANPTLLDHVTGYLKEGRKLIVRTAEEEAAHLEDFESKTISKRVSDIALNIEKDVKAITGIDKLDSNEKYYEYVKRAAKTLKEEAQQAQRDVTELKGKTNLSEAERQRLTSLEQALKEKDEAIKNLQTEKEKEVADLKKGSMIDNAITQLRAKFKKELPESLVEIAVEAQRKKLIDSSFIDTDGTLKFLDAEKKVLTDAKDAFRPKSAISIAEEAFKDLLDTGRKQEGAGASGGANGANVGNANNGANSQADYVWGGIPSDVKTKVELTDHLKKSGVLDGTDTFNKVFEDPAVQALPLR